MSNRFRNNLFAVCFVIVVLILMVLTTGCMTTYSISKTASDGSSVTVDVSSFREFQQPQVHYNKTTDTVTFTFGAESATTAQSPIERSMAKVLEAGGSITAIMPAVPNEGTP